MSFVFRGSRGGGDLESGFADFLPEHRNVRFQGNGRPASANPMTFFVTVLVLFMILNSHQMSPNFLLWLGMGIFLMATSLRMYALCQQLQAHAHAHAAAATAVGGLVGHTEFRLRIPPSIAFSTRGRLQGLRLQLALLDREFDDLDYDALRALDGDNPPGVASLSESEINALPLHTHKSLSHQVALVRKDSSENGCTPHPMPSGVSNEKMNEAFNMDIAKGRVEELTCSVCLEQVNDGEFIRSLPCVHQFHAACIDRWLRQQATCPVCKFKIGFGWQAGSSSNTAAYTV